MSFYNTLLTITETDFRSDLKITTIDKDVIEGKLIGVNKETAYVQIGDNCSVILVDRIIRIDLISQEKWIVELIRKTQSFNN